MYLESRADSQVRGAVQAQRELEERRYTVMGEAKTVLRKYRTNKTKQALLAEQIHAQEARIVQKVIHGFCPVKTGGSRHDSTRWSDSN